MSTWTSVTAAESTRLKASQLHGKLLFKFFVVVTGETKGAHKEFIRKLEHKGHIEIKSVDQSDYILAFCPSPSRTGTDVQEAMRKIPSGKPVILVVMHHRHDVEAHLDDSSRHVSREDVILTVDTVFWEGEFKNCSHNKKAFSKVLETVGHSSCFALLVFGGVICAIALIGVISALAYCDQISLC